MGASGGEGIKPCLCRKCGVRPMVPSGLKYSTFCCSKCIRQARKIRNGQRWTNGERPKCKKHPWRIVNRSCWVASGKRECGSCHMKRPDGTRKPAYARGLIKHSKSEQRLWQDRSWRRTRRIKENRL